MGMFDFIKPLAGKVVGTTAGKVTFTTFVITVGGISYKVYQDSQTGDVVGAEVVEKTVAKNDAQGDVRLKMEGLKDAPKDAEAEKAAAEAAARAAEEAAKAKEAEAAKLEEALKEQREAEEAAALAEQQAQGEDGVVADEEQNPDDLKDENADEGDGENDAEAEADDDEKGPDTYKGDDVTDEQQGEGEGEGEENKKREGEGEGEENKKGEGEGEENKKGEEEEEENKKREGEGEEEENKKREGEEEEENKKGEVKEEVKEEEDKEEEVKEEVKGRDDNKTPVDNDDVNKESGDTPTGGNLNSTYRHDNYQTASGGSSNWSVADWRRHWLNEFRSKSEIEMYPEDIRNVGGSAEDERYSSLVLGMEWAAMEAAKRDSKVSALVFDSLGEKAIKSEERILGIERAVHSVLFLKGGSGRSFGIEFAGASESEVGKAVRGGLSFARDQQDGYRAAVYGRNDYPNVAVINANGIVYFHQETERQQTPQDDPMKKKAATARKGLLERFRAQEIAHVNSSDREFAGVAWAVEAAMTDPQSKVKELHFDIKSANKDFEAIGDGICEALSSGKQLRRDIFSIRVDFKPGFKNDRIAKAVESAHSVSYGVMFGGNRIFVCNGDAVPVLYKDLGKRFEQGRDCCVDEWELAFLDRSKVNGKGLKEILCLAAKPESKVNTLRLKDSNGQPGEFFVKDRLEEFEDALEEICRMPEINKYLKIQTNLREEAPDLEERLNKGDERVRDVYISALSGTVAFSLEKVSVSARRAVSLDWEVCKEEIPEYFKTETGEVSWNDVGDYLSRKCGSSSSSGEIQNYSAYFGQLGLECACIPFAANPESKIKTLTLGKVNQGTFVHFVRRVLSMDNIHEFDLYVSDAEHLLKEVDAAVPLNRRRCRLTYNGESGMLEFRNLSAATATGVPAKTPGTGAVIAIDEVKLGALEAKLDGWAKQLEADAASEKVQLLFKGSESDAFPWIYAYGCNNYLNENPGNQDKVAKASEKAALHKQKDNKEIELKSGHWCYADGGKQLSPEEEKMVGEELSEEEKTLAALLQQDSQGIVSVLRPSDEDLKGTGLKETSLILGGVCHYNPALFADGSSTKLGTPGTRNYFAHPWIRDVYRCGEGMRDQVKVTILKPDGIAEVQKMFGDGFHEITTHKAVGLGVADRQTGKKAESGSPYLSPNIFQFRILRDGAHAWFLTECNDKQILIYWRFVEDADGTLRDKVGRTEKTILPCQFSPNENERDTKPLLDFLKKQQEQKEKEKEETGEEKPDGLVVTEDENGKSDNTLLKKIQKGVLKEEDGAVLLDAKEFGDAFVLGNFVKVVEGAFGNTESRKILMKGFAEDTWKRLAACVVTGAVESIDEPWELGIAGGKVIDEDQILGLGGVKSGFQCGTIVIGGARDRKAPKYEDGTQSDFDRDFTQSEDTGKHVLWFRFGDRKAYAKQISFRSDEVGGVIYDACTRLLRLRDDKYAELESAEKEIGGGEDGTTIKELDPLKVKVCIDDVETTFGDGVFDLFRSKHTDECNFDFKRVPMKYLPLAVQRGWNVEPDDDTCFRCYRDCGDRYEKRNKKGLAPFFVFGCVKVSGENGNCPVKTAVAADACSVYLTSFVLVPEGEKTYSVEVGEGARREIKAKPGTVEAIDFEDSNMIDGKIRARLLFIRETEEAKNALEEARVLCSYDTLKNRAVWRSALRSRSERRRNFYGKQSYFGTEIKTVSDVIFEILAVLNDKSEEKYSLYAGLLPEDVRTVVRYAFALGAVDGSACEAEWVFVDNKEAFRNELQEFVRSFNETLKGDTLLRVNRDGNGIDGFSPFISAQGVVEESETLDWLEKKVAEAVKDAAKNWIPQKEFVFKEGLKPSSGLVTTLLSLYPRLSVVCHSKPDWLEAVSGEFKKNVQIKKITDKRGAILYYRFCSLQEIARLEQSLETQIQGESGVLEFDQHMNDFLSTKSYMNKVLSKESKVKYLNGNFGDGSVQSLLTYSCATEHFIGIRTTQEVDEAAEKCLCIKEGGVTTCYPGGIQSSLRTRIEQHKDDSSNDFRKFANEEISKNVRVGPFVEKAICIRTRDFVKMSWGYIADNEKDELKQRLLQICIDGNPDDFKSTGIEIASKRDEKDSVKNFLKEVEQYVNGSLPYSAKCKISLSGGGTKLTFVENDLKEEVCDTPAEALLKGTASISASSKGDDLKTKMDAYAKNKSLLKKVGDLLRGGNSDPVPGAIPYGGGDQVACREEIGRWCVALNCFAVVIDDKDTVSFYSPYCAWSGFGSYSERGLFMQGVSFDEAEKYFSQQMLEKAVVLKPVTAGNRWCLLSSQARKQFVMRFLDESAVACPAPCENTLEKVPALSASGAETGEFRTLTDEDKNAFKMYLLGSSKDLPNMAWMFNPRVMTERLIRAKREADTAESKNTYVLICNPCKSFASDFLSSLQKTKKVEGASDGRFWISVPGNTDMTVLANAYDFGGTTFVTEPVANPGGRRYLRFANDSELAIKNAKVTDVCGVERENGCSWYRLREVLDAERRKKAEEEAKRKEEEEEEEKKRKEEEGREALKRKFDVGGEIKVDAELIEALGVTDVLGVIKKAAELNTGVTLSIKFGSFAEFGNAVNAVAKAIKDGGNKELKLKVEGDIPGLRDALSAEKQAELDKLIEENYNKTAMDPDERKSATQLWLLHMLLSYDFGGMQASPGYAGAIKFRSFPAGGSNPGGQGDIYDLGDALNSAVDRDEPYRLKTALEKGINLTNVFQKADELGGEVRFSKRDVSEDVLESAIVGWFSEESHKTAVPKWSFVDVDLKDRNVWKRLETLSERVANASNNGVFMYLDRRNSGIWFLEYGQRDEKLEMPELRLKSDGSGNLEWTDELKNWWWNCAGTKNLEKFTDALAELPELRVVDFTALYKNGEGYVSAPVPDGSLADEKLHCYRSAEGLNQLAKCSGVQFCLCCPRDGVIELSNTVIGTSMLTHIHSSSDGTLPFVLARAEEALSAKSDGTLLWNAYARSFLPDVNYGEEIANNSDKKRTAVENFEKFAEAVASKLPEIKSIDFNSNESVGSEPSKITAVLGKPEFWSELFKRLKGKLGNDDVFTFVCSTKSVWLGWDGWDYSDTPEDVFDDKDVPGLRLEREKGDGIYKLTVSVKAGNENQGKGEPKPDENEEKDEGDGGEPVEVMEEDLQAFFGKTEEDIQAEIHTNPDAWISVLSFDGIDVFLAATKKCGIKKLRFDHILSNREKRAFRRFLKGLLEGCPGLEISVKDQRLVGSGNNELTAKDSGDGYCIIKLKPAGAGGGE